ncbi:MAG TPA: WhiB family transcriptional regulator [Acidimicrobiia bacterium]
MRTASSEVAACDICGRERRVNSSRSRQTTCASCRYMSQAIVPGDWVEQALCAQVDPELFWPEQVNGSQTKKAQEICMRCPVIDRCLSYAIESNQVQGIWGGLTPQVRAQYRKLMQAEAS